MRLNLVSRLNVALRLNVILFLMAVVIFMSNTVSAAIELTDERATPEYWTAKLSDGDEIILSARDISNLNAQIKAGDTYAAELSLYPTKISAEKLRERILKANAAVHVDNDANQNLDALTEEVAVSYAVTMERVNVRLLPKEWSGDDFDDLQGTALDPCEPVVVLWESADKKYFFVQARNYFGWIDKSKLAMTTREHWLKYVNPKNFIVVTANKKAVNVGGQNILFQMGAVIPLHDRAEDGDFWLVKIPAQVGDKIHEQAVKIAKDNTVHKGFLPCTKNNFIRQSFKFLGDVYGWGGLKDSVDCSAFTSDIYRSMGIEIPRDADRQFKLMPHVATFGSEDFDARIKILQQSPTGALLLKRGHVLMLLGNDSNGTPIAIHAASSYYLDDKKIYVSKVLVSAMDYPNDYGVSTVNALLGVNFVK